MSRFMTGLLLGVGLGILLAPEKGADTRESIAETAGELKDQFNKILGRSASKIDDLKGMLANEIDGLSEDVRSRIRTILDENGHRDAGMARTGSGMNTAANRPGGELTI